LEVHVNHPLAALTDQFLKERTYLKNVTERTLVWYRVAFENYVALVPHGSSSLPTRATMQQFVVALRERGIKPASSSQSLGVRAKPREQRHDADASEGHAERRERQQVEALYDPLECLLCLLVPPASVKVGNPNEVRCAGTLSCPTMRAPRADE
jgi:hypothetical protein